MAVISRIAAGQTLYKVERSKMGNTTISIGRLSEYKVSEVHAEAQPPYVMVTRNGTPRKVYERDYRTWKVKKPQPKGTVMGQTSY